MTTSWRKNLPAEQRSASDRRSQSTSTLECLVGVQLLTGGFLQRKSPRAFRIPVRPNHTPAWPRPHDLPAPDRSVTASPTPASVRLYSLRASTLPSCVPVSPKHYPKYPAPTPPYAVASTTPTADLFMCQCCQTCRLKLDSFAPTFAPRPLNKAHQDKAALKRRRSARRRERGTNAAPAWRISFPSRVTLKPSRYVAAALEGFPASI
jgi:hypothetical protein